jgi:hypothetical protein
MALGDLRQVGSSVAVGFDDLLYGTMLMRVANAEPTGVEAPVLDGRGALYDVIVTNDGVKMTLEGGLLAADLTAFKALKIDSIVTVDSKKWRVTAAPRTYGVGETTGRLELSREDSLTDVGGVLA